MDNSMRMQATLEENRKVSAATYRLISNGRVYKVSAKVIKARRSRFRKSRRDLWRAVTENTIFRQSAFPADERQSSVA